MRKLLGYSRKELLALDMADIDPDATPENLARTFERIRNGGSSRSQARDRTKDGTIGPAEVSIYYLKYGEKELMGCITGDITERKEAEARLLRAQKMEAMARLTGGIAHEFSNLLTVIVGNLQLLVRGLAHEERHDKRARAACAGALKGAELIRLLLAFAGRQVLEPKLVDVNKLVRGMERLLRRTLGEAVELRTVPAGGLWRTRVDPSQLESALLNLAINARDAMLEGGKLTIETANTRLADEYMTWHPHVVPGDYVMLSVNDTGAGMSADVVEQAFEPFFTTKRAGQRGGLGLSVVYGFVKQSGGYVNICSEQGHGTSVKLYLPRAPRSDVVVEEKGARGEALPAGDETVPVVEDDAAVRETAVAVLEELGYRVIEAEGGPRALAVLKDRPEVGWLSTDIGMMGADSARKGSIRHPSIKALFASGHSRDTKITRKASGKRGALFRKLYDQVTLAEAVRTTLGE